MYCICSSCCLRECLREMYSFLLPPFSRRLFRLTFINKLHILLYIFLLEQRYKIMWWAHFIYLATLFFFFLAKIFASEVTGMSQLQHDQIAKSNQRLMVFTAALVSGNIFGEGCFWLLSLPQVCGQQDCGRNATWPSAPHKAHKSPTIRQFLQSAVLYVTFFPHGLSCYKPLPDLLLSYFICFIFPR